MFCFFWFCFEVFTLNSMCPCSVSLQSQFVEIIDIVVLLNAMYWLAVATLFMCIFV